MIRILLLTMVFASVIGCSSKSAAGAAGASEGSGSNARPAAVAKAGTRENPVPVGDGYVFKKSGRTYEVSVLEAERNATRRVKAANQFNRDPEAGQDYIVTKLHLAYTDGPADRPFPTPSSGIEYFAQNRMWGGPPSAVAEEPKFSGQNIFPGATVDGWLSGKYLPTESMDDALLVFDGVYFLLP